MNSDLCYFWSGRLTQVAVSIREANQHPLPDAARKALTEAGWAVNRALTILDADRVESARREAAQKEEGK